jgi:hypothetical protein
VPGSSHRFQWLFTLRMLVVPESGCMRSNSSKSRGLLFACGFSARFFAASISAFCDDDGPHLAITIFGPPDALRTIGAG